MNRFFIVLIFAFSLSSLLGIQATEGKWIAPSDANHPNTWMTFRKDIILPKRPEKAVAQIAVDSKYWLWINGQLAVFEGGVKRGPTPKDTYYDEVDLAPFLQKGKNQIAILVWYFGKEGFSHKSSGQAGLLFNLESKKFVLGSDETWLCRIHPAYGSADAPYPNFRLPESNIRFDARKDMTGWQTTECPETLGFSNALVLGTWGEAPYNKLIKRPIPQWKDFGMRSFESMRRLKGEQQDTLIALLPYNLQMTPILEITDPVGGNCIGIYTDNTYAAGDINLRAEYITRRGRQSYESLGWLNGHEVYFILPKGIEVNGLKYRETGYNTEMTGSFSCDNDFVNRFWKKALRTLYVNMRDTYFDCPERERAQWWGDEVILMGECFYTCSSSVYALMSKGIKELIAWQHSDGALSSPIPAGNYDSELPGQMLASIGYYGFWNYYMNTGDRETIAQVYPGVKRYLELWTLDSTGLTNFRGGSWTWGDWGEQRDIRLIFAGWHYLALKGARQMAQLLGETTDANNYSRQMNKVKEGYNRCWNGYAYRHPEYNDCTDDRVQALAVVSGIAEQDKYPYIIDLFKKQFYASPYMEKYVMEALFVMGEGKYAMERMQKRFAPMVNHPFYTTLFEGWDIGPNGFGGGTVNHAWSGGPLIVIARYVCGIEPLDAAYKTFRIAPDDTYLHQAAISVPTIAGEIRSSFESSDKDFKMEITVPKNTQAILQLPNSVNGEVRVNGKVFSEQGCALSAGTYTILAKKIDKFKNLKP